MSNFGCSVKQLLAPSASLWLVLAMMLFLVKESVELKSSHPLHQVVDKVNEDGPYIGLVVAFPKEEKVLLESGYFVPNSDIPYIRLTGRQFNIGTINGVDVVYVMTGEKTVNAGVAVQILLDLFDISGIVHYGIAGSTNDTLLVGDVGVAEYFAFTDSWHWKNTDMEDDDDAQGKLQISDYNTPKGGGNLLGKVEYQTTELFTDANEEEDIFWLPVNSNWYNISTQLQGINLTNCMNATECLPNEPKISHGLRGGTASLFLKNTAYRKFLYQEFNISIADEESASVVMTALSNDVPCIVFRAISDMGGAPVEGGEEEGDGIGNNNVDGKKKLSYSSYSYMAAANALNVAVEFIDLIASSNSTINAAVDSSKSTSTTATTTSNKAAKISRFMEYL